MVFGTLVYNEILIIPYLGLNKNTKAAIKARDAINTNSNSLIDRGDDSNAVMGYAATSPHAGYDSKRNERVIQNKMHSVLNKTEELSITEESDFSRKK